ncbi:beta-ketoacyl-ACP synthase III [Micromonosporaceae bacterium Da 78-11]
MTARSAVLSGLGAFVPPRVVTNDMLAQRLATSDEWIHSRTGIRQRNLVDVGTATSDLAVQAGTRALKSAGVETLDLVVLATTTPDHPCPGTAPTVAAAMGLGTVAAFDVAAVCSGFVYALATASGAIAAGLADRVLVIGADAFSSIVNPQDRTTAAIFADGAGAVVLRAGDADEAGALTAFDLGSDGSQADIIMVPGGGSRQRSGGIAPDPDDSWFTMQGKTVFREAVRRMTESSRSTIARTGWTPSAVDWLVGHQANARILHGVADQLPIPRDRAVVAIENVGNTSAASIPLALADRAAAGVFTPGDRMILTAFGGGLTWGSAALTWPDLHPVW